MMGGINIDFLSDFITFLRFKKKIKVNQMMADTGLSRPTIHEIENKIRKKVSNKVYTSFQSAYPQLLSEFEKDYKPKTEIITATKEEFENLKDTVAKMAQELINLSQDKRALIEENEKLKNQIKTLKGL